MTSRMTKARNFSAKSGSSLLTAARCRGRLACSASLPGSRGGSRAGPSICRARGYTRTARPTCGRSRHRYYRCYPAGLEGLKRDQQYLPSQPLFLVQIRRWEGVWIAGGNTSRARDALSLVLARTVPGSGRFCPRPSPSAPRAPTEASIRRRPRGGEIDRGERRVTAGPASQWQTI